MRVQAIAIWFVLAWFIACFVCLAVIIWFEGRD